MIISYALGLFLVLLGLAYTTNASPLLIAKSWPGLLYNPGQNIFRVRVVQGINPLDMHYLVFVIGIFIAIALLKTFRRLKWRTLKRILPASATAIRSSMEVG